MDKLSPRVWDNHRFQKGNCFITNWWGKLISNAWWGLANWESPHKVNFSNSRELFYLSLLRQLKWPRHTGWCNQLYGRDIYPSTLKLQDTELQILRIIASILLCLTPKRFVSFSQTFMAILNCAYSKRHHLIQYISRTWLLERFDRRSLLYVPEMFLSNFFISSLLPNSQPHFVATRNL